jgi:hypothetical protein
MPGRGRWRAVAPYSTRVRANSATNCLHFPVAASRTAAGQETLLTTEELVACGLGEDAVAYRLKTGRLHVVFRGVYSFGCGELPPFARELAGLKACGEASFVSHRSAAFVWGFLGRPPAEVEVSVVESGSRSRDGLRAHRVRAIDKRELRRREGLWVSSPARVCLEIAATSPSDLLDVIDQGLGGRRLSRPEIEEVLHRHRGQRGAARLAEVLGDESAMTITRSRAEKAMLKLISDQPWVPRRPQGVPERSRKDLFYRDLGFDLLRFTRARRVRAGGGLGQAGAGAGAARTGVGQAAWTSVAPRRATSARTIGATSVPNSSIERITSACATAPTLICPM